jgi:Uma2 family endonuclease
VARLLKSRVASAESGYNFVMTPTATQTSAEWTVDKWLQAELEPRCELQDGILLPMASLTRQHQEIVLTTAYALRRYVRAGRLGVVLMEVDVALPDGSSVIPDICFVRAERESEVLTPSGKVRGAPDLAVEVVSPSTRARDTIEKARLYHAAGIAWYWLIDSETLAVQELRWTPDGYVIGATAMAGEPFRPDALPGFEFNLQTALAE